MNRPNINKNSLVIPPNQSPSQFTAQPTKNTHFLKWLIILITVMFFLVGIYLLLKSLATSPNIATKNNEQLQGDKIVTGDKTTEFFFPEGSMMGNMAGKWEVETGPGYIYPPEDKKLLGERGGGVSAVIRLLNGSLGLPLKPFRITMHYSKGSIKHLNEKSLSIYYGDEDVQKNPYYLKKLATKLDVENSTAVAESSSFGNFGILGVLKCPNDVREDNDGDSMRANWIPVNIPIHDLFDINEDVDWFAVVMQKDKRYTVEIKNFIPDVPIIELTSDGFNVKQDNLKNLESKIEVNSNLFPYYDKSQILIKLSPRTGSKSGCEATYDLLVSEY